MYNLFFIFLINLNSLFFTIFFSNLTIFLPILLLILLIFFILFLEEQQYSFLKNISFLIFFLIFVFYSMIFIFYSKNLSFDFFLFFETSLEVFLLNLNIIFAVDTISLLFLILTSLVCFLSIFINWNFNFTKFKTFIFILALLEIFLILSFMSLNFLVFYFFFESTLIPMFFIISYWGSRSRKIHASYMFFFYTAFGSIFLLLGLFMIYSMFYTFDIRNIYLFKIDYERQIILWLFFFIGFSVKVPLPPFHIWLPEAHVEAPTFGSMILAGILLKLGSYGMLRFMLPVFNYANFFFAPAVYTLCIISIIYISALACRQIDMKKIIAYSSIAHMSFVVIGLFSFSIEGVTGSIFLMLSHGLISAGLFACIGILYDRYGTRLTFYYSNVAQNMPIFSIFFFLFILSNIGFPLTSGFIGEFLICISAAQINFLMTLFLVFSVVLTAIYCFTLFNHVIFSRNNFFDITGFTHKDLTKSEFFLLIYLFFFILFLGVCPSILTDKLIIFSEYYLFKNLIN